ncbi:hypothetical protein STVA_16790 [Allostella vacuolata]|nr:hypothetical protein STVA_16790 [Stella vacuolata]
MVAELLLFGAFTPATGWELWRSDGRTAGTELLRDLVPDSASGNPYGMVSDRERAYFFAEAEDRFALWSTDGTAPGTVLVDRLSATDGEGGGGLFAVGDALYFSAADAAHGEELWVVRPGIAAAAMVSDLRGGADGSAPSPAGRLGGALLFSAIGADGTRALWRTAGTAGETERLTAADVAVADGRGAVIDGVLYFTAADADHGAELWRSDGTAVGTVPAADILAGAGGSDPGPPVAAGDVLYFAATGTGGRELWRFADGTAARVADIRAGDEASEPTDLAVLDGVVYFAADDGAHGRELWRSDGSADGTWILADIRAGAGGSGPQGMTAVGGRLYFTADDGVHGREAWVSDGTAEGTRLLADLHPAGASVPHSFAGVPAPPAGPDTIAPDTYVRSGPPPEGSATSAAFEFASDEQGVAFEAALDGGPWQPVGDRARFDDLSTGEHVLQARAIDPAGNVDPTPVEYGWAVAPDRADTVPPIGRIVAGPPSRTSATLAVLDLAADEAFVRFEGRLDDGDWQPAADPVVLFDLAPGSHQYAIRAIDAAGNLQAEATVWSWLVIDDRPPADAGPVPDAGGAALVIHGFEELEAEIPEGIGRIQAHASLRLPDGVPNLSQFGAADLNGEGNGMANHLVGNGGANILVGYDGRDSIEGGGGADFLAAGAGDDTLWGDDPAGILAGPDTLWGGQGNDSVLGGGGTDLLNGDRGADTLQGGAGADTLNGGADGDRLDGGSGADRLRGGQGDDRLLGGPGGDTLAGDLGADTLWGGEGADLFLVAADGSVDVIADFTPFLDRIGLAPATGIADEATFRSRLHESDGMTLLDTGEGGWMILLAVTPDELTAADLLFL